jgi:glycine oxidase
MKPIPDVAIVGGGIIGLTAAHQLAREGVRVAVLERGEFGHEASWAGAGILPPGNLHHAQSEIDRLRAFGVERMAGYCERLTASTGLPTGYWRSGAIEFLSEVDADIPQLWAEQRIPFEKWSCPEMAKRHPEITLPQATQPFFLPGCAQVRNPWFLRAIQAECLKAGVQLISGYEVRGWHRHDNAVSLELQDGTTFSAGTYLIASGAWAERLLNPLGCHLAVHPVRGQIVLFRPESQILSTIVMLGKSYLVPRADGRILAGSTEEPEVGFEKGTTSAARVSLHELACELVPALHQSPIEAQWSGLRPGSPDGLPFIGAVPGFANVFAAVGHFRAGVQLSLGTAELVAALVLNRETVLNREAFRLDRPSELRVRTAFRS